MLFSDGELGRSSLSNRRSLPTPSPRPGSQWRPHGESGQPPLPGGSEVPFLLLAEVVPEQAKWAVRTFTTAQLKQGKENYQRLRRTLHNDEKISLPRRHSNLNVYAHNNGAVKYVRQGFPGGAVVKNPPANARDTGSSPGPGGSHMLWSNLACAPQLLRLHSRACKPQLLRSTCLEPMLRSEGGCLNEKPAHCSEE